MLLSAHRILSSPAARLNKWQRVQTFHFLEGMTLQLWTEVLRQFTLTNAFELTVEFCIWIKTPFSSVVTPPSPKQCCKNATLNVYLFPTLKKEGGEATFASWGEGGEFIQRKNIGNFHVSHQLLSMIVATTHKKSNLHNYMQLQGNCKQFNIVDQDIRQNKMVAG